MLNTYIITPSYINSNKRFKFAQQSLSSLQSALGDQYPMIVVDDIPKINNWLFKNMINPKHLFKAYKIYGKSKDIHLVRQLGRGSRLATLQAIHLAKSRGADLVFIHLDDNIYLPIIKKLMSYATDAFEQDQDLVEVRLTGYPILSSQCNSKRGNLTQIKIECNQVKFDSVILISSDYHDYTLWWSYYHENMVDEDYWPIALWSTLYRVSFLEKLLTHPKLLKEKHLVNAEIFYKQKSNFIREVKKGNLMGKIGYINMQFCGLEMHQNCDWKNLIHYPNIPVRAVN